MDDPERYDFGGIEAQWCAYRTRNAGALRGRVRFLLSPRMGSYAGLGLQFTANETDRKVAVRFRIFPLPPNVFVVLFILGMPCERPNLGDLLVHWDQMCLGQVAPHAFRKYNGNATASGTHFPQSHAKGWYASTQVYMRPRSWTKRGMSWCHYLCFP